MGAQTERTTLYLRGMPRRVVREAKAVAARRGATLATVVSEALTQSLGSAGSPTPDDELEASMRWFEKHRARIERRHRGEYIAIVRDRIADHDASFSALAERMFRAVGERPIYMPKVGSHRATVRVRSPRVVG